MKETVIKIEDRYGEECLVDRTNIGSRTELHGNRKPQGYVEIYEIDKDGKKQLVGKSNLVVYLGREWLGTRIFNTANAMITPLPAEWICWFGIGTGGAPVGDPLNPTSPTNLDTDLDTEVGFNSTDPTYGDFRSGIYYKHPFDSVAFEEDADNSNSYLICRIIATIGIDDGNGNNISEAALFTAASDAGGYAGPYNMFARVTFPSIVKTTDRQLIFVWYIYV